MIQPLHQRLIYWVILIGKVAEYFLPLSSEPVNLWPPTCRSIVDYWWQRMRDICICQVSGVSFRYFTNPDQSKVQLNQKFSTCFGVQKLSIFQLYHCEYDVQMGAYFCFVFVFASSVLMSI